MFCADSSSWIAYLSGKSGEDIDMLDAGLLDGSVWMVPMVLAELLSDPLLPPEAEDLLLDVPLFELTDGFWQRAGKTRAEMIKLKFKPKLADTLIAQVAIEQGVTLHTRDMGFRAFEKHAGLKLVLHGVVN